LPPASLAELACADAMRAWLRRDLGLTTGEAESVEACVAASLVPDAGSSPDALCQLPEQELRELLLPLKPRGLRALVRASLADRKLAMSEKSKGL